MPSRSSSSSRRSIRARHSKRGRATTTTSDDNDPVMSDAHDDDDEGPQFYELVDTYWETRQRVNQRRRQRLLQDGDTIKEETNDDVEESKETKWEEGGMEQQQQQQQRKPEAQAAPIAELPLSANTEEKLAETQIASKQDEIWPTEEERQARDESTEAPAETLIAQTSSTEFATVTLVMADGDANDDDADANDDMVHDEVMSKSEQTLDLSENKEAMRVDLPPTATAQPEASISYDDDETKYSPLLRDHSSKVETPLEVTKDIPEQVEDLKAVVLVEGDKPVAFEYCPSTPGDATRGEVKDRASRPVEDVKMEETANAGVAKSGVETTANQEEPQSMGSKPLEATQDYSSSMSVDQAAPDDDDDDDDEKGAISTETEPTTTTAPVDPMDGVELEKEEASLAGDTTPHHQTAAEEGTVKDAEGPSIQDATMTAARTTKPSDDNQNAMPQQPPLQQPAGDVNPREEFACGEKRVIVETITKAVQAAVPPGATVAEASGAVVVANENEKEAEATATTTTTAPPAMAPVMKLLLIQEIEWELEQARKAFQRLAQLCSGRR